MKKNDPIQKIRTLLEKKSIRKKEKMFVVEGPHLIEEGLAQIEYIVYTREFPVLKKAAELGIPCYRVSERDYKKATGVVTPQGIMAVAAIQVGAVYKLPLQQGNSLIVFCVDIQDPGNLGTIIRTADAAAGSGIIVTAGGADPYNQKVIRSGAGSIFHLPVIESADIGSTLRELKQKGFRLIAADTAGVENFWETDYRGNIVILIGNEGAGLPESILKIADAAVKVPIIGRAESLNAAMAAGIVLYEAVRQRMNNG